MGSTTASLAGGATTVWPMGRFDPAETIALTLREGVTSWSGATTHIFRLVDHPELSKLETSRFTQVGIGGSATTPELIRTVSERFPHLAHAIGSGYGSSETGGPRFLRPRLHAARGRQLRRPAAPDGRDRDPRRRGAKLPEGRNGHIWVRSPMVMLEYLNNPKANAESFRPGRWVDTGDLGHLRGGRLHIESRLRDMIIRGGENVYPAEIENQIEMHPDVAEVAVYGVPDRELGQRVKAVVVPPSGGVARGRGDPRLRRRAARLLQGPRSSSRSGASRCRATRPGKVMKHVLSGEGQNTFLED
jgi:acyl-CoA synthetase (AMP-forming)/AMP-acid ligase II